MGQTLGLDTQILIYYLEDNPEYADLVETILETIQRGAAQGVFASVGLIEILTGPKKRGDYDLAAQYRQMIPRIPNLILRGINENVIDIASDLRAHYKLATIDAIHLATAIDFGADKFITNDRALKKVKEIKIEIL